MDTFSRYASQAEALAEEHMILSGMERLQAILVELLTASQDLKNSTSPAAQPLTRGYLKLARECACTLDRLERLAWSDDCSPGEGKVTRPRLATALDQAAGNRRECKDWQRLFEAHQYQALVEGLPGQQLASRSRGSKRRGMGCLTRRLAERALPLKEAGVSWSRLLSALIRELQTEPGLDAEGQVLLARLLERQARARPQHSGAYLRLTIARYKADLAAANAQQAALEREE